MFLTLLLSSPTPQHSFRGDTAMCMLKYVCSFFTLEGNDYPTVLSADKKVNWLMVKSATMGCKYSISPESLGTLQHCSLDNVFVTRVLASLGATCHK